MRVTEIMSFKEVLLNLVPEIPEYTILAFDPGETTGVAVFHAHELIYSGQIDHREHGNLGKAGLELRTVIKHYKPTVVVIEDYRVYHWKAKDHTHSDLFTSRLIGTVEMTCAQLSIPLVKQMASIAKRFMTDKKLKDWDFWIRGQRHARDAIRHGASYILFQAKKAKKAKQEKENARSR